MHKNKAAKGNKKNISIKSLAVAAGFFVLALSLSVGVYSKYTYGNSGSGSVSSKPFYFNSDLLSSEGAVYTLNTATSQVSFSINNSEDDLRFAQMDISYSVSVEKGSYSTDTNTFTPSGEASGVTVAPASGTLAAGPHSAEISLSGMQNGNAYRVTVTGSAGYQKAVSAIFCVNDDAKGVYKHLDTSATEYVVLTVWVDNISGVGEVTFPAGLIPDSTDPVLTSITSYSGGGLYTGGGFTDSVNFTSVYSSASYRFFKVNNTDSFSADSFKVFVNGTEADKKEP